MMQTCGMHISLEKTKTTKEMTRISRHKEEERMILPSYDSDTDLCWFLGVFLVENASAPE